MVTPSKADEEAALQAKHITVGEEERKVEGGRKRKKKNNVVAFVVAALRSRNAFRTLGEKKNSPFLKPPSLPHSPTPPLHHHHHHPRPLGRIFKFSHPQARKGGPSAQVRGDRERERRKTKEERARERKKNGGEKTNFFLLLFF